MPSIPVYNPSGPTIPAFSVVRLAGEPIRRGHQIAWPVIQVGDHADDADASRLAFVGAVPIASKGYGRVTQTMARVQTAEVIPVGSQLGPRPDEWDAELGGGCVSLGRDTTTAKKSKLCWAAPGPSIGPPVWCQGWLNSVSQDCGTSKSLLNRDYPIRFWLQQPPQLARPTSTAGSRPVQPGRRPAR